MDGSWLYGTKYYVSWPVTMEPKAMDGFAHSIDLFPSIAAAHPGIVARMKKKIEAWYSVGE